MTDEKKRKISNALTRIKPSCQLSKVPLSARIDESIRRPATAPSYYQTSVHASHPTPSFQHPTVSFFSKHKPKFHVGSALKPKKSSDSRALRRPSTHHGYTSSSTSDAMSQFYFREGSEPPPPPSPLPHPSCSHMLSKPPPNSGAASYSPLNYNPMTAPPRSVPKLKSLVISPNLDELLKHDEMVRQERGPKDDTSGSWYAAHTNPPPSPILPETPCSLQSHTRTDSSFSNFSPPSPYSPRSPCSFQARLPSIPRTHPASPSSSASYAWSPVFSPVYNGSPWGHTPDTSVASLGSYVDNEPVLKGLTPPPRLGRVTAGATQKRRATVAIPDGNGSNGERKVGQSRLRSVTVPSPVPDRASTSTVTPNPNALSRRSRGVVDKIVAEVQRAQHLIRKNSELEPFHKPTSEAEVLKIREAASTSYTQLFCSSSSESAEPGSESNATTTANIRSTSDSSIFIDSSSTTTPRQSPALASSSSSSSSAGSSDSTETLTPARMQMQSFTTPAASVHTPERSHASATPTATPTGARRSLRASKSAYALGQRSNHAQSSSASLAERQTQTQIRRMPRQRVLSAEDVLGEFVRKEDALDTLLTLARTGTGIVHEEEDSHPQAPPLPSPTQRSSRRSRSKVEGRRKTHSAVDVGTEERDALVSLRGSMKGSIGTSTRSTRSGSTRERLGTSFLRLSWDAAEEDHENGLHRKRTMSSVPSSSYFMSIPLAPRLDPAPSTEVSVMCLDTNAGVEGPVDDHAPKQVRHPYSKFISETGPGRQSVSSSASSAISTASASSATASESTSSTSRSGLSYARSHPGGAVVARDADGEGEFVNGYVAASKMASVSESTKVRGGSDVDVGERHSQSRSRRQRPFAIAIIPANEDGTDPHSSPDFLNKAADSLPQLPQLIPPSPLSASFDRSLSLSLSGIGALTPPSSAPPTDPELEQQEQTLDILKRETSRSSTLSARSEETCSSESGRRGSISTIAFGVHRRRRRSRHAQKRGPTNEESESNTDIQSKDSSNGYEGDYNSASAESSSEAELDISKYYRRRVSEDLYHTQNGLRSGTHHPRKLQDPGNRSHRIRTKPATMARLTTSYYSSADGDDHERYMEEVRIIDMRRAQLEQQPASRLIPSNSHAFQEDLLSTEDNDHQDDYPRPRNTNLTTTNTTTSTTPQAADGLSTTLSEFQFADEDPWTSTEQEEEAYSLREETRISISSTVYSASYYDPYDVLPTPRSAVTFGHIQPPRRPEPIDTMRRERNEYEELQDRHSFIELISPTDGRKPPLPTTPKPDFSNFSPPDRASTSHSSSRRGNRIRRASQSRSLERRMPKQDQGHAAPPISKSTSNSRSSSYDDIDMLPPTSNTLDPLSRADLVRKSRKLAQVFGQTPSGASLRPSGMTVSSSDIGPSRRSFLDITSPTSPKHHRATNSIATFNQNQKGDTKERVKGNVERVKGKGIWPPPPNTQYMSAASGRRHSTPLTPDEFEFLSDLHRREPVSSVNESTASSILDLSSGEDGNLIEIGEEESVKGDRMSFIDWDDGPSSAKAEIKDDSKHGSHPIELQTNRVHSRASSRSSKSGSSLSSLAFAPPSAYPGAPRNSFVKGDQNVLDAAPFDTDDEDQRSQNYNLRAQRQLERQTSFASLASIRSPSLMSPEERAEAERRRNRQKLAKLHRFLGSRVPAGLVLGADNEDLQSGLPGLSGSSMEEETDPDASGEEKNMWQRAKGMGRVRRTSGSESASGASEWSDLRDRRGEDLGDEERMRMVKRAVRLEKVFGVAPPKTLYHPRSHLGHVPHSLSTSGLNTPPPAPPRMLRSSSAGAAEAVAAGSGSSGVSKKDRQRPQSRELLLPKGNDDRGEDGELAEDSRLIDAPRSQRNGRPRGASLVYSHYEHSITSLGDILDRDDRASLKELHEYLYLHGSHASQGEPYLDEDVDADYLVEPDRDLTGGPGGAPLIKSERRRSLPARTSIASLNSLASMGSLGSVGSKGSLDDADAEVLRGSDGDEGSFQMRRRRAAKLTQFFGVDYRHLIRDVLESIETGVELERGRGRIGVEEAEDLMNKLRLLKGKRTGV